MDSHAEFLRRVTNDEALVTAILTDWRTAPVPANWKSDGYLERLPRDPWGNPYLALSPGLHGEIDVFSYGADGVPGGEGFDADVGNWSL